MRKTVNEASARPRKTFPVRRGRHGSPGEFAKAFGGMNIAERFFDAVTLAAEQSGCRMLFEIPGLLLDRTADRAAAISSASGSDVFFIGFNSDSGSVIVVAASEAPSEVIDFTRSYAGVLGMIARDRNLVAPLLQ